MTSQPFNAAALRGAVDLSSLARPTTPAQGGPAGGAPAGGPARGGDGLRVEATEDSFTDVVNGSVTVPAVVILWSSSMPETAQFADLVESVARASEGRFRMVSVDADASPGLAGALMQAVQVQTVPVALGLVQGQPVPLFAGVQPREQVEAVIGKLLELAVQHGVTGRVEVSEAAPEGEPAQEAPLPPLHQEAYDAIERDDLDAAVAAYERALLENPADADAKLGLAQVNLMRRTAGADLQAARAAAAAAPEDVAAQTLVADLDVLGGHVEDAFGRLIDLVRVTSGDERNAVREHLLELFEVVGTHDERVRKARGALMSALF
ncbi:co-chaperone YbbN [Oryzihumus sp.]|jgi:putative thioredoxin|uniref:co-chaperone YbbN n=1 Tax=Oryzihumus sp. TaxID=1968903 RepID=UPI002ED7D7AD